MKAFTFQSILDGEYLYPLFCKDTPVNILIILYSPEWALKAKFL